jgi:hypothetical protein
MSTSACRFLASSDYRPSRSDGSDGADGEVGVVWTLLDHAIAHLDRTKILQRYGAQPSRLPSAGDCSYESSSTSAGEGALCRIMTDASSASKEGQRHCCSVPKSCKPKLYSVAVSHTHLCLPVGVYQRCGGAYTIGSSRTFGTGAEPCKRWDRQTTRLLTIYMCEHSLDAMVMSQIITCIT